MQARHDRRTRWIVAALVVACGMGVASTTTSGAWDREARVETQPLTGYLRPSTASWFAHVAVLRLHDGALRVVPGSESVTEVPAGQCLAVRRDAPEKVNSPSRSLIDVLAAPSIRVRRPAATLHALLGMNAISMDDRAVYVVRREFTGHRPGDRGVSGAGDLVVDREGVFGPTIGTALGAERSQADAYHPDLSAQPFRDEILVARVGVHAMAEATWAVDNWRAAVRRQLEDLATQAESEPPVRRRGWGGASATRVLPLIRLAMVLGVRDAVPAITRLRDTVSGDRAAQDDEPTLRFLDDARRALGDRSRGTPDRTRRPHALGHYENLGAASWSLIARATPDPDVAAWAVAAALDSASSPETAQDLLDAHESGGLALDAAAVSRLDEIAAREPPSDRADFVAGPALFLLVLTALAAFAADVTRRWRREYTTSPRMLVALVSLLMMAGLDTPVIPVAPCALLAAAALLVRLGRDIPGGGTRRAAGALAAAAALWGVNRIADSVAIEALGRAVELGALVLMLGAARRAEPALLDRHPPQRSSPGWTAALPYVALSALAGFIVWAEIDSFHPLSFQPILEDPSRAVIAASALLAAGACVLIATRRHSAHEHPPVVRTFLGLWLAMLHVAAIAAALLANGAEPRSNDDLHALGAGAAVLFTLLVCLRLDNALIDRALHHARSRMIRAVREVEDSS